MGCKLNITYLSYLFVSVFYSIKLKNTHFRSYIYKKLFFLSLDVKNLQLTPEVCADI
jgi:hypothetical protein